LAGEGSQFTQAGPICSNYLVADRFPFLGFDPRRAGLTRLGRSLAAPVIQLGLRVSFLHASSMAGKRHSGIKKRRDCQVVAADSTAPLRSRPDA
jgi:hypothetical protein